MQNELLSIIVPVYKREKFIKRCIDSILNQTYDNTEVIVVYNESPDRTLEIIETYGNKIKLIKQGKTSPAIARNVGIAHANGTYVAFCDSDDYFARDKLEKQMKVMRENPDIGVTYTDAIIIDSAGREIKRINSPEWELRRFLLHRGVMFPSVVLRKDVLDILKRIDGYYMDEKLGVVEDFDFLIRLSKIAKFKSVHGFLLYCTKHSKNISADRKKIWRARTSIFKKHGLIRYWIKSFLFDFPLEFTYRALTGWRR
jgi:glycosyltransferase involved in cell wall biosynthesis